MDCRRDAGKLHPGLHEIIHKELKWMSETGVHPQHSSISTHSSHFQCQPLFKVTLQFCCCFGHRSDPGAPSDLFVITDHSEIAVGASSSPVPGGVVGTPAGPLVPLGPVALIYLFL